MEMNANTNKQSYMIVYVWEDTDAVRATGKHEQKFGEHFCEATSEAEAREATKNYIRNSLGRQKNKFDNGRVVIHNLWNVSDYAQRHNRFKAHAGVDNLLRKCIGHRIKNTEVHTIDASTLIERVNRELVKHGQPMPVLKLSQNQFDAAINVLDAIKRGCRTIMAELAARFGKTIWSGALVRETGIELIIVASYVGTSFTSFKRDFTDFEQFRDLCIVEVGKEADWKKKISDSIKNGKQCVALLSMCQGSNRQNNIDFLFGLEFKRLVIIDEADFGVHQQNQSAPLSAARREDDIVILMTGTGADRAVHGWPIDHYLSVTYAELLMEKKRYMNGG
jgi:hypothetical protein